MIGSSTSVPSGWRHHYSRRSRPTIKTVERSSRLNGRQPAYRSFVSKTRMTSSAPFNRGSLTNNTRTEIRRCKWGPTFRVHRHHWELTSGEAEMHG